MGRKAQNKIKVTLQIPEMSYQRLAIAAGKNLMGVTSFLQAHIDAQWGVVDLPLLTPTTPLTDTPPATSDLQSNADSRTEDEPRQKKKR